MHKIKGRVISYTSVRKAFILVIENYYSKDATVITKCKSQTAKFSTKRQKKHLHYITIAAKPLVIDYYYN